MLYCFTFADVFHLEGGMEGSVFCLEGRGERSFWKGGQKEMGMIFENKHGVFVRNGCLREDFFFFANV